jgi:lipoyl-dependent peroxiredoxin
MAKADSTAHAVWQGDLMSGTGTVSTETGVVQDQRVTWTARVERVPDTTSPEELLAAAHASCFAMAFSLGLAQADSAPDRLEVTATTSFEQVEGGFRVTRSRLAVVGQVSGIDEERFAELARGAGENCPISQALKGNVEIEVDARLSTG